MGSSDFYDSEFTPPYNIKDLCAAIRKAGMGKQGLSMPPNNTRKYLSKNRSFPSFFLLFCVR